MVKKGDVVLLYRDEKRNFLITVKEGKFHTDLGFVNLSTLINKRWGEKIETSLGKSFYLLKPTLSDMIMQLKRKTQIIYPKEIGAILLRAHIFPGAHVIECGAGSGALTTALAQFVRPQGRVYSYERNIDFFKTTQKNVQRYGLSEWVEFKNKEIIDGFDEKDIDFVMIDIGSPWELIDAAFRALKGGGRLATICPTFEQLTTTVFTLEEKGFVNIETMEILIRRLLVRRGKTRPEQRMPSHTGYLVFGTKTIPNQKVESSK